MTSNRNAFRAGIFMLVTVVLIIGGVVGIAGSSNLFETWRERQVAFSLSDNLGGLRVGDDVRIGGVKVGQVRSIEIQTEGNPRILIHFTIPHRYPIKEDARIGVEGTVTGTSWLNIDSFGAGSDLQDNVALTGRPSALSSLLNTLSDAAPEVKKFVTNVNTVTLPKVNTTVDTFNNAGKRAIVVVDHVNAKIDPVVEKYNGTMDTGKEALANVRDLIGSNNPDFKGALANVHVITGDFKEKVPALLARVEEIGKKVSGSLDTAKDALESVKATAANLKDASGSAKSILIDKRSKIDAMIDSMKIAGDNLKFATAEVRRSPWRLLYHPGPNEQANLNLYDSARCFADGASALSDASQALRDSLKDPNVKPDDIKKLTDKLDESFEKFQAVESDLYKRVQVEDKSNLKLFVP